MTLMDYNVFDIRCDIVPIKFIVLSWFRFVKLLLIWHPKYRSRQFVARNFREVLKEHVS